MKNYQNLSWDDIKAMYAETDRRFKKTEQLIKENTKQFKETDKKFKETDQRMAKSNEELRQIIKELSKELGGVGHSNGDMAEEYFFNAFNRDRTFVNEHFDKIKKNMSYDNGDIGAEFDLVLFNGKSVALIEVKYNAKPENIEISKLISKIDVFKILFPDYKNHKIYLGVAAMSFKKDLVWRLHRAGIATIRPVGGKKMVVYDKTVKVF